MLLSKDGNDYDHGNDDDIMIIHTIAKVRHTCLGCGLTKLSTKDIKDK